MEENNLRGKLKKLTDKRRKQGQQHALDVVLMITIMATMSGFKGYRAIGDFAQRYKKELVAHLLIAKGRIPSFSVIRRVLMNIDTVEFDKIFTEWMGGYCALKEGSWISVDGKAIKGTKQSEEDKQLAHLVSFFASDSKDVIQARKTATKSNEIPLVQEMIEQFPYENVIITLDAMHCQKETLKAIKDSGNDYVVQVKKNQKNS